MWPDSIVSVAYRNWRFKKKKTQGKLHEVESGNGKGEREKKASHIDLKVFLTFLLLKFNLLYLHFSHFFIWISNLKKKAKEVYKTENTDTLFYEKKRNLFSLTHTFFLPGHYTIYEVYMRKKERGNGMFV